MKWFVLGFLIMTGWLERAGLLKAWRNLKSIPKRFFKGNDSDKTYF